MIENNVIYKRIVIKVGTNVLTKEDGTVNIDIMRSIVQQIVQLKSDGFEVVLVSSGAVGSGKSIFHLQQEKDITVQRQVYSAIGQVRLMNIYADLFGEYNMICAQVLATKYDFTGKEHYKNMKNCFFGLLNDNVIPIVNENDVVALDELMFTDNDQLAGLTAFMIEADALIILSDIDGLFDRNPEDHEARLIGKVLPDEKLEQYLVEKKSSGGRGGMQSKVKTAQRCARKGIVVHIANGLKKNIIIDLFKGTAQGTLFVPDLSNK